MLFKILIQNFKDKLLCPLITSFIIVGIVILIFFPLHTQSKLKLAQSLDDITIKIDSQIKECGTDYWISWIIFDDSKRIFKFQDLRGFNKNGTTIISSINLKLNPFYLKTHIIDPKTLYFLSNFETGTAGFYKNVNFFNNYPTAKEIILQSNKQATSITIAVTKNFFSSVIYVFLATTTSSKPKCSKEKILNSLEDLSIYAKGKI